MKVLVILIDGMRPDVLAALPEAQALFSAANVQYTLSARTVMPSVTLPCHVSLFHSVAPTRHGTTTNTYAPQVRPVPGLCEVLAAAGKSCAFFYNWEPLRDLSRPDSLAASYFFSGGRLGWEASNRMVTDAAIAHLQAHETDFAFVYLGNVDAVGHTHGWMSAEYRQAVQGSLQEVQRLLRTLPADTAVMLTADHGGHDRTHGTELPEDMTIPLVLLGDAFPAGLRLDGASILDLAPTVAALFGVSPAAEWEGKTLL